MGLSGIVYFAVLVSAVYGLPPKRFLVGDRCTQDPVHHNPHFNPDDPTVIDYDVDMTCINGTISWDFPYGTIRLHFRDNTSLSVCFPDSILSYAIQMTDITDGANKPFTLPDERGEEYCVHSVKNRVDIQMYYTIHLFNADVSYRLEQA